MQTKQQYETSMPAASGGGQEEPGRHASGQGTYSHETHIEIIVQPSMYEGIDRLHVRDGGLTLIAPSMVYHPHHLSGSMVMIENMPDILSGMDCLDLGCGAGVIALSMLARGAQRVVATDISERACATTECNAILNAAKVRGRLPTVLCGDLFSPIATLPKGEQRFDLIVFNMPLMDKEPGPSNREQRAEESLCDPDGRLLARFLDDAAKYLKPGGRALFPHSSISAPLPRGVLEACGAVIKVLVEQNTQGRAETFTLIEASFVQPVFK